MAIIQNRSVANDRQQPESGRILQLTTADDPSDYADQYASLERIEINFGSFTDGRAHSLARVLRSRYGYRGELRATGHILPDQLSELERCGFDSVEIPDEQVDTALRSVAEITVTMQPAVDGELALRRRFTH